MPESSISLTRGDYYNDWLEFFDLPEENDLGCSTQMSHFPRGGAADVPSFWHLSWKGYCVPATWETPYSIYARDDYKRCVCEMIGEGEADCPTAEPTPAPEPTPTPTPDPEVEPFEIDI